MIHIVFLAQLREQLGIATMDVPIADVETVEQLKNHLVSQNPSWEIPLLNARVLVAVNHTYAKSDQVLVDGDEVAFFPPVTGG